MNSQETTNKILDQAFDRSKPLTPRRIKARKLVAAVLEPGATYKSVGEEIYPTAKYPAVTVYNCLKQPGPQEAMQEAFEPRKAQLERIAAKIVKKLEAKIDSTQDLDTLKQTTTRLLELQYKEQAMLAVRNISENSEKLPDLSKVPREQLEAALLKHLELSAIGVQNTQQSLKDDIRGTIPTEVQPSKG